MSDNMFSGARWPDHLLQLCLRIGPEAGRAGRAPDADRGAAWLVLHDALARFLRGQAHKFGGVASEELRDLASSKALELLGRVESGEWRLEGRSPGELAAYLATVARHALSDLKKRTARMEPFPDAADDDYEESTNGHGARAARAATLAADAPARADEFIVSLRDCLRQVQPRARRIWFLRVFYEMSTRAIAQHPTVMLRTGNIDVIMQRTRDSIRSCMQSKGFEPSDMPAGTFTALWEFLESMREATPAATEVKARAS
jgi:RNA polymerase sigma factor (sigma-70 family)